MNQLHKYIHWLYEGSRIQRLFAALVLGRRGNAAKAAMPALRWVLHHDPERAARRQAVEAIGQIGVTPGLVLDLAGKLAQRDECGYVRAMAGLTLLPLGSQAAEAVPLLMSALRDPDPFVRFPAALVLTNLRQALEDVVPVLAEALRDWTHMFRDRAVQAVFELGPVAAATREALTEHLAGCRPSKTPLGTLPHEVRQTRIVVQALRRLGPESIPALVAALNHPDPIVAATLVPEALADFGEAAVPYLLEAAASDDQRLQQAGLFGLHLLGESAWPALPRLEQLRNAATDEAARHDLEQTIRRITTQTGD
jgi:HEAT repeat protein